jgi:eukaryotic-like serine/threonine-protein kinase
MPGPDTLIDTVFDGRYKIVRKLGTGGHANVFLAEDQELGRRVAIKILDDRHAEDEQFVERFRREAKNAAGLSHPNIVSIYDRGEAEGTYYIAMEFLDGRTLKELLVKRGPTPIPVAIDYARQILAALGFAHRNGVVHRDIKPHNVSVAGDGRLKVMDFGIARAGTSAQMTETGSIIGTAQYLSPEQAKGQPVTPASDIYSVGVVLYEMLTGSVPFTGDTPLEIAMKHLSTVPEPPSEKRPEVPHDLDSIVLRSLAKRPEDRYQSAGEMDADLARAARGQAVDPETEEMATQVLRGVGVATIASAPTEVVRRPPVGAPPTPTPPRYGPPTGYYEYDEPRRRSIWPWLLAAALIAAAVAGGWYVYTKVQNQLNQTKPVAVPLVEGSVEHLAVQKVEDAGLKAHVVRLPSETVQEGYVIQQNPAAGERIDKGNTVTLDVSTGRPKVVVPGVIGKQATDAVAALTAKGLVADVHHVNSDKPTGEVTGQDPPAGKKVLKGEKVRINVSQGPKPIAIPPVVGQPYDSAASTLQGAGFAVARRDVDSNDPKGTVVQQDPGANTLAGRGATVTLFVSKGPTTTAVPDVTSFSRVDAISTLRNSGFRVLVENVDTTDPTQDGVVLTQTPQGGEAAKPGATVTVTVGHYTPPPPPPTTEQQTTTAPVTTAPATTAQPPPTFTDTTTTDTTTTP